MPYQAINFSEKFHLFTELWAPRVVAEFNDYQLKLVKIQGEFVWHAHEHTDEVFVVLAGAMEIVFRDGRVALTTGEMYVVPKGVEHKPVATEACQVLLIEPRGVVNTGADDGPLTADNDVWV